MKVLKIHSQFRRDCHVDVGCENCQHKIEITNGYDDRNYWDNVIPNMQCQKCFESTKSLGLNKQHVSTRYSEDTQI